MNLTKCLILALPLFAVAIQPLRADDRKDIDALYDKLLKAIVTNHAEDTLNYETSDFVAIGPKGDTSNGAKLVEELKKNAPMMHFGIPGIKVANCKIKGKAADVAAKLVITKSSVDTVGTGGPKGMTHVLEIVTNFHNILSKTADGWKFKTMKQIGNQQMFIDGKLIETKKKSPAAAQTNSATGK